MKAGRWSWMPEGKRHKSALNLSTRSLSNTNYTTSRTLVIWKSYSLLLCDCIKMTNFDRNVLSKLALHVTQSWLHVTQYCKSKPKTCATAEQVLMPAPHAVSFRPSASLLECICLYVNMGVSGILDLHHILQNPAPLTRVRAWGLEQNLFKSVQHWTQWHRAWHRTSEDSNPLCKHVADPSLSFHVLSFLSNRYTGAKQTFISHLRKGSEAVQFLS